MRGMKDYISDQNRQVIENAIHTLKEELDFDAAAISQLHFAIYLFQESVSIPLFLKYSCICKCTNAHCGQGGSGSLLISVLAVALFSVFLILCVLS